MTTRLVQLLCFLFALALLAVACGGGSDSADSDATSSDAEAAIDDDRASDTAGDDADEEEDEPTAEPVVIPTSTPLPTPTPLPSATPEPLEQPTPSTVLLTTAFTNSSKVTTVGIDEVFFGMTADEAAEAASTAWVTEGDVDSNCYLVTPASGPDRIVLWVVDGRIERIDIEHPDLRTPSRLGIGNTAAELKSQLGGRLTVETSGDGGSVATFAPTDPGDRDFRIIFELIDDKVVKYRTGRIGVVQRAIEGC